MKTVYHIIKKEVENRVFENWTIDGYNVIDINGTNIFVSDKKSCPESLKNIKDETTCTTIILVIE